MAASKADQDLYDQTFAMSGDSNGITTLTVTGQDADDAEHTVSVDLTPELMGLLLGNITKHTFSAAILAGLCK